MNHKDLLFPHEKVRNIQGKLLEQANKAVTDKHNLIAHAPTGLGKTAAVLAPALKYALDNDKTVFFLTSRHTQHLIAIDTLKEVKKKHNTLFKAIDIIGKKWLCLQPTVSKLMSGEFAEYCRKMREDELCEYYTNLKRKDKLSSNTKRALTELGRNNPKVTKEIIKEAEKEGVCPYEISMLLSKDANVIITDYFYIFNPKIRENFMKRTGKELEDCIVIVDEAHNLPDRLKDLSTQKLSNFVLSRASAEAEKHGFEQISEVLRELEELFVNYSEKCEEEMYVSMNDFYEKVNQALDYDELVDQLLEIGGQIREEQKRSYVAIVGEFLEAWPGPDKGFARIFSVIQGKKGPIHVLSYRCMDPSIVAKEVFDTAHSTILMSGTLTPTSMYKELLGISNVVEQVYPDPFPKDNRLNIIIPRTSTKYATRSEKQYKEMAEIIARAVNKVPGNSTIFFPSYYLKNSVKKYLEPLSERTIFNEVQGMTKEEKHEFLEKFKKYKDHGAVLLGVISGSFGEGIDLPGDYLKAVIVVGLPLQKPDLETKALIDYYDKKFGKGWDYGYLFPAFNKTLQSAGRCIRSETDRGVIMFLDERYVWSNYKRCFPPDWNFKVTVLFDNLIEEFFN